MKMSKRNPLWIVIWLLAASTFGSSIQGEAANRRTPVVEAAEKISPAVVNINTVTQEQANPFRKTPFSEFFGRLGPSTVKRQSLGSGVIIRPDGYIITNNHVIDGASEIRVTLSDEREFTAEVVGADPASDLAVIKVTTKGKLPAAAMGKSDDLMAGETIIAIGNPFGLSHTVTTGVISAIGRTISGEDGKMFHDFIQLDAPINPGNSGGALVNINGELIGVTAAVYSKAEGIGFAIPIDKAKRIVTELISFGSVSRAWYGLAAADLSKELRYRLGWKGKGGALIIKIFGGGPAKKSGLVPGDIVTAVNGKKVSDRDDFYSRLGASADEAPMALTIFRNGKELDISIKGLRITPAIAEQISYEWIGVTVAPADKKTIERYRLSSPKGLVIKRIDPSCSLAQTGVREGDLIRKINRTPTDSMDDFRKAVMESQGFGAAIVYVQRGQFVYQITVGD